MSQWTHVAGMIRVDALVGMLPFGTPGNPDLKKLIGPMCLFDDWNDASTLPRGSEGSIQYHVSEPEEGHLAAYVVSLWGDLRDYSNVAEIEGWLNKTFEGLMIRSAVVMVEVEYGESVVIARAGDAFERVATISREPEPASV